MDTNEPAHQGLRRRHLEPSPPAPVPATTPARTTVAADPVEIAPEAASVAALAGAGVGSGSGTMALAPRGEGGSESSISEPEPPAVAEESATESSDSDVVRSTGSMAVATLLSRITGFVRIAVITSLLGSAIGSAFQTANTLPNLITEIVLGSVMTALVVPVLVRAEKEDPDKGAAFIRRLFTLTVTLLTVVTLLAVIGAPLLTRLLLAQHGQVNVGMSTSFAFLVLPQIFFYGLFSLFMAVLNTKGIFRPGAWAPVANNLVSIAALLLYGLLPGQLDPGERVGVADPHVLLLGLGTTLGVVVQCAIMVPSLRRAGIDLRPLWGIDDRLKQFGGMAVAIIVYVAISQLGYIVTNRIASQSAAGPIIYSNAWLLLQVPYGIIGVTLLTAIMPRLSRNAADGDDKAVVKDLTLATQLTFIALIPIIVFFTGFGMPISFALFQQGRFTPEDAELLGLTLAFSAFTLIPYALVMLHLRVFYARESAWTPTFIVAGITVTKIILSVLAPFVASSPEHVVILLGAANGFGYLAGAVIGIFLLRSKLGSLQFHTIAQTSAWALASSLIGLAVALLAQWVLLGIAGEPLERLSKPWQFFLVAACGLIFLVVTGLVLSRSRLAEVQNLGRLFSRLPVIGRFIRVDEDRAINVAGAGTMELSAQLAAFDAFNASPVPPPMSAGVVRGPRLVPGAPVSDGRFRLLSECGSVQGAQFWKAREQETGQTVGLTFVDTSGQAPLAPRTQAEMARTAGEVSRMTRKLAGLDHPGIADNIRILSYRTGCLIVADWVEGSSLRDVADNSVLLDPKAVAGALAPLAEAAADAHAAGTMLGLDNSSRIRITTEGTAVLAFPAVLPQASLQQDASSLASAIGLLADATCTEDESVDSELAQIAFDARAVANETDSEPVPGELDLLRDLASRLRAYSYGIEHVPENRLIDAPSEAPATASEIPDQPAVGFGSSGYTRGATALVIGLVMFFVLLIAAATTLLTSLFSGDNDNAPVNSDSIQGSQVSSLPRELPLVLTPDATVVWQAPGEDPAADHPEAAGAAGDDDPATAWTSDSYPEGMGTKPGIGLAVTLAEPATLESVRVDSPSRGARYAVYALPAGADPRQVVGLSDLRRIAAGELRSGPATIELEETTQPSGGVILWFTELPPEGDSLAVEEISLVGHT
ncbi:membrane protein [Corynebacterium doosanense CAU 212 = DSM 45436]|uniref:Membrane protein n=1 Tax=Corynebacterium doosanense CAU 212 = DSM 45436 TaxID=558173 RepID=A0A097IJ06_9CORY|nr:membrane protein [Corynebacterium doosanense CAU 212 = DSM 45436]